MVSSRCKKIVSAEVNKLGIEYRITLHGAFEFLESITPDQINELKTNLLKSGFVLLDETESMLVDRIIISIMEIIHYSDTLPKTGFSELIRKRIGYGDESVFKIFSDVKGMSLVQFIVSQKIERVKAFLLYDDLSLAEIADKLSYKNEHYLAAQLKKVTGLTPSYFVNIKKKRRSNTNGR